MKEGQWAFLFWGSSSHHPQLLVQTLDSALDPSVFQYRLFGLLALILQLSSVDLSVFHWRSIGVLMWTFLGYCSELQTRTDTLCMLPHPNLWLKIISQSCYFLYIYIFCVISDSLVKLTDAMAEAGQGMNLNSISSDLCYPACYCLSCMD